MPLLCVAFVCKHTSHFLIERRRFFVVFYEPYRTRAHTHSKIAHEWKQWRIKRQRQRKQEKTNCEKHVQMMNALITYTLPHARRTEDIQDMCVDFIVIKMCVTVCYTCVIFSLLLSCCRQCLLLLLLPSSLVVINVYANFTAFAMVCNM